jgi:hypothetical protein
MVMNLFPVFKILNDVLDKSFRFVIFNLNHKINQFHVEQPSCDFENEGHVN